MVVENDELVETCKRYDVASVEAFQVKVGGRDTLLALLDGDTRVGADGGAGAAAVKLQTADQALVPMLLVALTRQ